MIFNYETFLNEHKAIALSNLEIYLKKMMRGLEDKIFFLNKIDTDCIVDFGCADGYILKQINKFNLGIKLIGYDYDRVMLNAITEGEGIMFTDSWYDVVKEAKNYKKPTILLSSVIHEVYSYGNDISVSQFWKDIFMNTFKYVAVRDMMYSEKFQKFSSDDIEKIRENSNKKQLDDYERVWGKFDSSYMNTLHWLLKYPYVDNWNRELHENYLPLSIEEFKLKIPSGWTVTYENQHMLGHVQRKIKREMDVDLTDPTHVQMIIKNNN